MTTFSEAAEIALRTWYPKIHPLHSNPHHPLGKLLGEWGELLDDYLKSKYKPGYEFAPGDELGDVSYYIRILGHQCKAIPRDYGHYNKSHGIDWIISDVLELTANEFNAFLGGHISNISYYTLSCNYTALLEIAKRYNMTFDKLIASNWEKLKPGSERGEQWMKARQMVDYMPGGKIG